MPGRGAPCEMVFRASARFEKRLFETELLLAHELVRAQLRYEKIAGDDEIRARLRPFLSSIRMHHGIEFTDLEKRLVALS